MAEREDVVLTRDVNIVTIPDGNTGTLTKGQIVTIHQALGDNYTVVSEHGHMVRIAGVDADALGKEPHQLHTLVSETDAAAVERNCWEVMKTVYDPEIPVNIVDLGLVYQCKVTPTDNGLNDVHIMMTLTAPGCGMGPVIQGDVEKCIRALPGVASVNVEVVLDPPWSRDMMSEVAQLQLGLY
ncbi:putative Fe-S cluster assembly protein SufT [Methylobacter sp. Wu8]|uniref:Putative FeS assembly SUF system protein SufT n=1 Tax=Methylobacter tundripaludum TaxID=173365 RepID=A0A2S6H5N8_9GAMM|nr:putative Fe-S cluster assembly protein SufT [Methylobacter tundripaludum]MCF7965212.1 putative Fe-S cluster assembly protein SufT [Methylobacter tundripaludum]MCK9635131.1 putative Fe-S cluster assembly protein SufT [Methylobacter tundripaludum]PPK72805.1 putative FeS assembly SUF system protein SufT [Methylobacter tundripaludum]